MRKIASTVMVALLTFSLLVAGFTGCSSSPQKYEETREMWDTFINVTVYSEDETLAKNAIKAAFDRMVEIGNAASEFDPNAQVYKLNQQGYLDNPTPDLVNLIKLSKEYHTISGGAFDITVQPVLLLWAGGLWKETLEVQQQKINETLKLVDSDKIDISDTRISFQLEGMKITLGGITKGYASDEALKVIKGMGIKYALVGARSDMASLGAKPGSDSWQIALVNPDDTSQTLATFKVPADKSISTSGNYERYFSPDKAVHHIIDPKTGQSAAGSISVTIIANGATQSDALATSVFVLGPDEGMKLVESLDNVAAFIVDSNREIHKSSGMGQYLA